jgi:phospholipid:diacylglycerol acyltransferase
MAAFLSGEMKDTVQLNPAGAYGLYFLVGQIYLEVYLLKIVVLERFFSRKERQSLFRSWAGSASMWIKVTAYSLRL